MSISEPSNRYSVIHGKNPREIVLLRGKGCGWRKCSFCDYHMDFSKDEANNYRINERELRKVTGVFGKLEVINSGSFCELDQKTIALIREVCIEKEITELNMEFHWMYKDQIASMKSFFNEKGVGVKVKMGVETFDFEYREKRLKKGIDTDSVEEISNYADAICLLFGLQGQTLSSMQRDIELGLANFERICINIMVPNSTKERPDEQVIRLFRDHLYDKYIEDERVEILMENTEFGVGDKYDKNVDQF